MAEKKCPRCGKKFNCESDKDCWCESYQIHKKEMVEIIGRYPDCLCPECLGFFAEK